MTDFCWEESAGKIVSLFSGEEMWLEHVGTSWKPKTSGCVCLRRTKEVIGKTSESSSGNSQISFSQVEFVLLIHASRSVAVFSTSLRLCRRSNALLMCDLVWLNQLNYSLLN